MMLMSEEFGRGLPEKKEAMRRNFHAPLRGSATARYARLRSAAKRSTFLKVLPIR